MPFPDVLQHHGYANATFLPYRNQRRPCYLIIPKGGVWDEGLLDNPCKDIVNRSPALSEDNLRDRAITTRVYHVPRYLFILRYPHASADGALSDVTLKG